LTSKNIHSFVLRDILLASENDEVLIITDDFEVIQYFSKEAKQIGINITTIYLPKESRPLKKTSKIIEHAIKNSTIVLTIFSILSEELSFRKQIIDTAVKTKRVRLAHMPNVDIDIIQNCIANSDFDEMKIIGTPLVEVLARARKVKIISKNGSNLSMNLGGWTIPTDAGWDKISIEGEWDNLPTGEVFKVPVENSVNGKLVIDGCIPGKAFSKNEKITLFFTNGRISKINDDCNSGFENYLKEIDGIADLEEKGNIYRICEFGIGINKAARKIPKPVEYEKKLGTAHIALGDNIAFNGNIKAPEHIDIMFEHPTIYIDGIPLMIDGNIIPKSFIDICADDLDSYKPHVSLQITNKSKIVPTKEIGSIEIKNNIVYKQWTSPGKIPYDTKICKATSILAIKVFDEIDQRKLSHNHKKLSFKDIINILEIPRHKCIKLIRFLYDYQLIEIEND